MIKDLKNPSVEDLVEAFKARRKKELEQKDAVDAANAAAQARYNQKKKDNIGPLYDLATSVMAQLVATGYVFIEAVSPCPADGWAFRIATGLPGSLEVKLYSKGTVWVRNDTLCYHLQFGLPDHELFTWTGQNIDDLTLKLCLYVGNALAGYEHAKGKV